MNPDIDIEEHSRVFAENYGKLNYDKSLVGTMMRHSHTLAERPYGPDRHFSRVLEVGAGTGEHLKFVRHGFDDYVMTDFNPTMLGQIDSGGHRGRVTIEKQDATRLDVPDNSVDRLIATHVLEHLPHPHNVLREWHRVLKPGGIMTLVLPCDPGLMWRTGRHLGPRRRAQRLGMNYDYVMAREHINSVWNLVSLVRYYFDDVSEAWSPLGVPLPDFNLFYVCQIRCR